VRLAGLWILLVAVYAGLFKRVLGIPVRRLVTDLLPALCGSVALVAVGLPVAAVLRESGEPTLVLLIAVAANGALAYLLTLSIFFRELWDDILAVARRIVPERLQPKTATLTLTWRFR